MKDGSKPNRSEWRSQDFDHAVEGETPIERIKTSDFGDITNTRSSSAYICTTLLYSGVYSMYVRTVSSLGKKEESAHVHFLKQRGYLNLRENLPEKEVRLVHGGLCSSMQILFLRVHVLYTSAHGARCKHRTEHKPRR